MDLRRQLGSARFAAAWVEGQKLEPGEAVAYALEVSPAENG